MSVWSSTKTVGKKILGDKTGGVANLVGKAVTGGLVGGVIGGMGGVISGDGFGGGAAQGMKIGAGIGAVAGGIQNLGRGNVADKMMDKAGKAVKDAMPSANKVADMSATVANNKVVGRVAREPRPLLGGSEVRARMLYDNKFAQSVNNTKIRRIWKKKKGLLYSDAFDPDPKVAAAHKKNVRSNMRRTFNNTGALHNFGYVYKNPNYAAHPMFKNTRLSQ